MTFAHALQAPIATHVASACFLPAALRDGTKR
jgi:hypothetical protein